MAESPRIRRLRNDRKALEQLRAESSILNFDAVGEPAEKYLIRFYGKGLCRPDPAGHVAVRDVHEVRIKLGASYPRIMPELTWMSPIFHPNISASGVVCLGGYGTHWVPSLSLDELCGMLWDMIRYRNYDVDSPYNREAALWAKSQSRFTFPIDERPIRDRIAHDHARATSVCVAQAASVSIVTLAEVLMIEGGGEEVIDAQLVSAEEQEIVFLD
ncbi:MAG: ubiquitin-conjugating enzyme E2 [Pirellulaceae bacterium]